MGAPICEGYPLSIKNPQNQHHSLVFHIFFLFFHKLKSPFFSIYWLSTPYVKKWTFSRASNSTLRRSPGHYSAHSVYLFFAKKSSIFSRKVQKKCLYFFLFQILNTRLWCAFYTHTYPHQILVFPRNKNKKLLYIFFFHFLIPLQNSTS